MGAHARRLKMATKTLFTRAALRAAIVALAISGGSVAAVAHAKLVSLDPAPAEKPAGTELRLSFSEGIELPFSKVTIVDANQKEMAQGALALDPADGKIVIVTLADRLAAGHYTVTWSVVSSDGHKAAGSQDYTSAE
jgi:methionine-rich copper-binding protein CopC